jgi:lipopolysaccharide/colanic/teichoic acid biosynthesis glycosyltransferase
MLPEQLPLYLHPEAYLALRPGITGLWQVSARNEAAFALRAVLDRAYLDRLSLREDLRIMAATFGAVVQATGY